MRFLGFGPRATAAVMVAVVLALGSGRAFAIGEPITDVRVLDNQRTEESTVRSIAGVSIGDTLEADTLDRARERLHTAGLFADVNVWWEPHGAGVRVNIAVKDKFPWAPVPTASLSTNNWAVGLVFVHGNLFGRGKQLVMGGRVAKVDSGALLGYRDPALFGSWAYWQVSGSIQRQVVPEYDNFGPDTSLANPVEIRETRWFSYGFEAVFGVAWLRRVRTQVAWRLEKFDFDRSDNPNVDSDVPVLASTNGGVNGMGRAQLMFDFRAREFAVMTGTALTGSFDTAGPAFKGDFSFWRGSVSWEQGVKFFRAHNFIYGGWATTGHNLPFWNENTAGGSNLRGYLFQQFRGDTQIAAKAEYHFPLFSISSLDFRALVFYDFSAIWFREISGNVVMDQSPTGDMRTYVVRQTRDARSYPTDLEPGFAFNRSLHNAVGAGLRFFLRSVAVPLVGFDAGYGLEARHWQFFLMVGA
jgi:outer membrane protein assembly factor BamA